MKELERSDRSRAANIDAIALAREAYRRGDFAVVYAETERTLDAAEPASELHLLRARALLRDQRAAEAEALLALRLREFADADGIATAAMLYGAAVGRRDATLGLALLSEADRDALRNRVHPSIRAEIAYRCAHTHWIRGDFADAERLARVTEAANVDVLAVRATHLRGFIAVAEDRLADGLILFEAARRAYGRCAEHDVELATIILQQIASLEQTLRCDTIQGTHRSLHGRPIPRASMGLGVKTGWRVRICGDDAWLFALDGDAVKAYAKAREAESVAPTEAWRVRGLSYRAAIAAAFDESVAAQTFADEAKALARKVDWNATTDDERFALLLLAEVFASIDTTSAESLLTVFDTIASPLAPTRILRGNDRRLYGWNAFIRGSICFFKNDPAAACAQYTAALGAFRECGYRWREAMTLVALSHVPAAHRRGGPIAPLDDATMLISRHFPSSFLARRLEGWSRIYVDSCGALLSPAQRDVLRWLLEGYRPRDIARLRGSSYETIRSHVRALHRAFGTRSEHALVVECTRRGILPLRFLSREDEIQRLEAPRSS